MEESKGLCGLRINTPQLLRFSPDDRHRVKHSIVGSVTSDVSPCRFRVELAPTDNTPVHAVQFQRECYTKTNENTE